MEKVKETTTNIGLKEEARDKVSQILNTALADEHVLYIKLRNYHWNVRGIHFPSLHELFEQQYTELQTVIDQIAERVRMVGHFALGTMSAFLDRARLAEASDNKLPAEEMLNDLLQTHEAMARHLRDDIGVVQEEGVDEGTADLLIAVLRMHEQMAWMLRSMVGANE